MSRVLTSLFFYSRVFISFQYFSRLTSVLIGSFLNTKEETETNRQIANKSGRNVYSLIRSKNQKQIQKQKRNQKTIGTRGVRHGRRVWICEEEAS